MAVRDTGLTPHELSVAADFYDAIDTERVGSITVARLQSHVHEVPLRLLEQNPHLLAEDDQTRRKTLGSTPHLSVGKENTLHIKLDGEAYLLMFLSEKWAFVALRCSDEQVTFGRVQGASVPQGRLVF